MQSSYLFSSTWCFQKASMISSVLSHSSGKKKKKEKKNIVKAAQNRQSLETQKNYMFNCA